jgi:hypothetical protein
MIDGKESFQSHARFEDWVKDFYSNVHSDLQMDGYDPDTTPTLLQAAQTREMKQSYLGCFIVLAILMSAIALLGYFRNR